MKLLLAPCLLALFFCPAYAQSTAQMTNAPTGARYEIILSNYAAKLTLKLDKYSGDVYLLVLSREGKLKWQQVPVLPDRRNVNPSERVPNYQIYTSGITIRDTYLLNVNTGLTWVLIEDIETGGWFWRPID